MLGQDIVIIGETQDMRPCGEKAIKEHLSSRLKGAAVVLVLVGQNTHNHEWVGYEIQHALSQHKKIIAVRIPNTTGALPTLLRSLAEMPFSPADIAEAIAD